MHHRKNTRLLLVEFIAVDRFIRSLGFPFVCGYAKKNNIAVRWLRFGLKASVRFERNESGIGLDGKETDSLLNTVREFDPTHILFNQTPSHAILENLKQSNPALKAGLMDSDSVMEDYSLILSPVRFSIPDFKKFLNIHENILSNELSSLFEIIEPDYGWTAGNDQAKKANPLPFIISGIECTYSKKISENPFYKNLTLENCPTPFGCAFCMRSKETLPWETDPLDLAMQQLDALKSTHPPFSERPQIRMTGVQIFFKISEFASRLKETQFQQSDFLFDTRADNLVKHAANLISALEKLRGTGHRIHLCLLGIENFSDKELLRMNKGINSITNLEAIYTLFNLEKRFPENFNFREHGGLSLIMFTPWTSFSDLEFNLAVISELDLADLSGKVFNSRVRLYKELPFTVLAKKDGLLIENYEDPVFETARRNFYPDEMPWRFMDERVEPVNRIMARLEKDRSLAHDPLYRKIQKEFSKDSEGCSKKDLLDFSLTCIHIAGNNNKVCECENLFKETLESVKDFSTDKMKIITSEKEQDKKFLEVFNKIKSFERDEIQAEVKKTGTSSCAESRACLQELKNKLKKENYYKFELIKIVPTMDRHVFVTLRKGSDRLILKIEKKGISEKYYLPAGDFTVSYRKDTPPDTEEKIKAIMELCTELKKSDE
jgi:hypothetical protein